MLEEKKEVKQITVALPGKIVEKIDELKKKKEGLARIFYQLSVQLKVMEERENDTFTKMRNTDESIGQKIKYSFDKLKLKKRKNYRWQYDSKGNFVGTEMPEPKSKVEEKKR